MSQPLAELTLRRATAADAAVCGQICYDAFSTINQKHGFPCDFPAPQASIGLLTFMFSHPGFYCVVAESAGQLVGSNCLDERSIIAGLGPITVAPAAQNLGVGRRLMNDALDRARQHRFAGVRLIQSAFHTRSLSLYASLGFDIREPLACMQGRTTQRSIPGCTVRPATPADFAACNELSLRIHGYDRALDLEESTRNGTARIVEREGRITGYASDLAFFGHATAETNPGLQALLASAESFGGPGVLIPTRNAPLFRWCLANSLRVVEPMTLMTLGLYNHPSGAWFPSILF